MPEPLTLDEVRHIARLARLRLDDAELETYREQLSTVLDHIAKLGELELDRDEGAPASRAGSAETASRAPLAEDDVEPAMPIEHIEMNAPAMEGRFIAVPKVLSEEGG